MAVLQPDAYEGILRMISQRAEQAQNAPPSTAGVLASAVGKSAGAYAGTAVKNKMDSDQEKDLLTFKVNLEKELERYKDEDLKNSSEYTQDDVNTYFKETAGIEDPKYIPKLKNGKFRATPEKIQELISSATARMEVEKLATQYDQEDPKRAAAIRALGASDPKEAAKEELTGSRAFGKLETIVDKDSSTGYSYASRTKSGDIVKTGLEAPKPTAGNRPSPSLDPRKRADEIRGQFKRDVDKSEFLERASAYKSALNSLENTSITNDKALIYSVARSREGGGRLSNQDVEQAARSGNLGEEAKQSVNRVFDNNKELTDFQRQQLVNTVIQNYQNASDTYTNLEDEYKKVVDAEDPEVASHNPLVNKRPTGETIDAVNLLVEKGKPVTKETIALAKKVLKERQKNGKK